MITARAIEDIAQPSTLHSVTGLDATVSYLFRNENVIDCVIAEDRGEASIRSISNAGKGPLEVYSQLAIAQISPVSYPTLSS